MHIPVPTRQASALFREVQARESRYGALVIVCVALELKMLDRPTLGAHHQLSYAHTVLSIAVHNHHHHHTTTTTTPRAAAPTVSPRTSIPTHVG